MCTGVNITSKPGEGKGVRERGGGENREKEGRVGRSPRVHSLGRLPRDHHSCPKMHRLLSGKVNETSANSK